MATTARTAPATGPDGGDHREAADGRRAAGPLPGRRSRTVLAWGLLAGLIVLQFVFFRRHALREVVWAYPHHCDQAYYLDQAYTLYERLRAVGCWRALAEHFQTPRPQGVLFPVPAAFLFLLTGPSRLAALTASFAHFALFQATLVATLRWLTRRWSVAFLGLGLLLAAVAPFLPDGGGLLDYRIDFTACCLFGTVICLVVRSRLLASPRWAAAVGAACTGLVLTRFLTMAYVAGIACLVLMFLTLRRVLRRHDDRLRRLANRQLGGLALAGAVVVAGTAPALWLARGVIYSYYVVGHVTGPEKQIRAVASNVQNALDLLLYYPRTLAASDLGATFGVLAAVLLAAAAGLAVVRRRGGRPAVPGGRHDWAGLAFFLAACALVPYALLTLDEAKAATPCSVLLPPVLWLVLLAVAAVARARPAGFGALAAVALAAGLVTQVRNYREPGYFTRHRPDVEEVSRIFDALDAYCRAAGCTTPRVAVTTVQDDYLAPVVIPAFLYERHGDRVTPVVGKLGGTLYEVTAAEALDDLRRCDFVILARPRKVRSAYPFDESMKRFYPRMKDFCDETLRQVGSYRVFSQKVDLYVRPPQGER